MGEEKGGGAVREALRPQPLPPGQGHTFLISADDSLPDSMGLLIISSCGCSAVSLDSPDSVSRAVKWAVDCAPVPWLWRWPKVSRASDSCRCSSW